MSYYVCFVTISVSANWSRYIYYFHLFCRRLAVLLIALEGLQKLPLQRVTVNWWNCIIFPGTISRIIFSFNLGISSCENVISAFGVINSCSWKVPNHYHWFIAGYLRHFPLWSSCCHRNVSFHPMSFSLNTLLMLISLYFVVPMSQSIWLNVLWNELLLYTRKLRSRVLELLSCRMKKYRPSWSTFGLTYTLFSNKLTWKMCSCSKFYGLVQKFVVYYVVLRD